MIERHVRMLSTDGGDGQTLKRQEGEGRAEQGRKLGKAGEQRAAPSKVNTLGLAPNLGPGRLMDRQRLRSFEASTEECTFEVRRIPKSQGR